MASETPECVTNLDYTVYHQRGGFTSCLRRFLYVSLKFLSTNPPLYYDPALLLTYLMSLTQHSTTWCSSSHGVNSLLGKVSFQGRG